MYIGMVETTGRPREPGTLFRQQFTMLSERLGNLVQTARLAAQQNHSKKLVEGTAALAADCMTETREKMEILIRIGRSRGYLPKNTRSTMGDDDYEKILPKYQNHDGSITIRISR